MQITIIKKNKLSIFTLPIEVKGSYWITDFENGKKVNLVNVEATKGSWNLISNDETFIVGKNEEAIPSTLLKEYSFYLLKNDFKNEKYYIYCSPVYDKTYKEFYIKDGNAVVVGSDEQTDITYKLNGVPKRSILIEKKDNYYYLTVLDNNVSLYVNQKRIISSKRLEYGDIIFLLGLKLILMRKNGADYLLINNPANLVALNSNFVDVVPVKDDFVDDHTELNNDTVYNEENYFYRAPHFYKALSPFILAIDSPPRRKEEDKTPAALSIGPMLTMSMVSIIMLLSTFNSISKGTADFKSSLITLVMAGAMLASSLLWPVLTKAYQKFSDKAYESKRQKLYRMYIESKENEIKKELEIQRHSLLDNYFTVKETQDIIKTHNVKLWQRRITDQDFLTLPIGIGYMPMQVEIKYPEEHFSLSGDSLLDIAYGLGKKERILQDVPITFSFYKNFVTGIVGDSMLTKEFIDRVVLQMMANYSYDELKIVTFTSTDNEADWDYVKILPHTWSNDKTLRYFGSSNDDYREIIYVLEKLYNERKQLRKSDTQMYFPHYVIITDAIKSIDNYDFIKELMSNDNLGFSIIMLVDKVSALPNECKNFIHINKDECAVFSSVINSDAQKFKIDFSPIDDIYNCALELANIPISIKSEVESSLPDVYQFLEMYQVGKIEQLNSLDRWKKSNPILSLQAPVGIGKSGEVINLDLHEKYHGPHGLIAGTTGSGKSEFIISYILSLAVNYHPYEVQVILIDYKGGSLAGAFHNDIYDLPHLAGTITNLDGNELNRSLASIESEIKRRQAIFNDAKKEANESTIDIYKYQKLWREGRLNEMEPVSHLFIICDEFAELKENQREFMDKLISAARVGRSLGIHLILATQKPGGVVDPQIWSNTRFRVCLKVQDTADSQEVLKKPDAAYLKKTGRFYLQVGYDEVFTLGQSSWTGGQYYPNTTFKKDLDISVNVINNIGFITLSKEPEITKKVDSLGEELPNVVKYLSDLANKENIKIKKLWLDKIPENIYIDSLKSKYNFVRKNYYLNPIIGEYDDPSNQNQFALTIPFSKIGNAIIYGIAGSGKEIFLQSLIYSLMTSYSPLEVNFYIVDFGAETLRVFADSPYVGDIVYVNDKDKLINLFKLINNELEMRRELFANNGGSYNNYIENAAQKMPNFVIVVNNFESFSENYEDLIDELSSITREAYKYGIYFVVTASSENSVRLKIKQNFSLVYVLQQNSDSDYANILGNVKGKLPSKFVGRGLFKNEKIYEFQTAKVAKDDVLNLLKNLCTYQLNNTTYRAKKVPTLPSIVDFDVVKNEIESFNYPIGVNKSNLSIEKYNFKKNPINCICSYDLSSTLEFINALINEVTYAKNYAVMFINATDYVVQNGNLENRIISKNFNEFIVNIIKYINDIYEMYENSGFDEEILKRNNKYMVFVYGVNDFVNKLDNDTKNQLADAIKKDNQIEVVSLVLVDSVDVIKNYAYEEWFKNGSDLSRGIWIGSGIGEQSLFKISKIEREDREDISNEYGYVIQSSKISRIKLLSDFKNNVN